MCVLETSRLVHAVDLSLGERRLRVCMCVHCSQTSKDVAVPTGNVDSQFLNNAGVSRCHREQMPKHRQPQPPDSLRQVWNRAVGPDLFLLSHLPRKGLRNPLNAIAMSMGQTGGISYILIHHFQGHFYIIETARPWFFTHLKMESVNQLGSNGTTSGCRGVDTQS